MITALSIIIFVVLSLWQLKICFTNQAIIKLPYGNRQLVSLPSYEMLAIVLFATAYIGLTPVLSIRLAFLEVLCVIGLMRCHNRAIISIPMILFIIFLLWVTVGIFYTPNKLFGFRMLLKYIYPLLIALFMAKVVKEGEIFITSGIWSRRVATIGIALLLVPGISLLIGQFFWFNAAFTTSIISMAMFSFALVEFSDTKWKNLLWGIGFCLPCLIFVYRTDIFGTAVALATFFLVKYRIKALPLVVIIGFLGLVSMFYIPSVKNKMFINPNIVTMTDFLTNNMDENNIRNNMRKFMWDDATEMFYNGHELIGSGTGRVQTFFYTEATDSRKGGQLHNDFLVIKCDNGQIGFWLLIVSYIAILIHCITLYHKCKNPYTRMAALVAGSSLLGVFVTMYSDNTLSYSMVTLSFPWGFYGMALGLKENLG